MGGCEMIEYKLVNDQFKDKWINKPNNLGDVGDLQDITEELNNLLRERDEWRKCAEKLAEIIGAPDEIESRLWKTEDEINEAWSVFKKLKEGAK